MNASLFLSSLAEFFLVALVAFGRTELRAAPFIPKDDEQILERLRTTPADPVARQLRDLRSRLAADRTNLALAAPLAWRCIERSRAEGDPRYLGRAQSALAFWWDAAQPPVEALVLRATIKQSQHDFNDALADLNTAVRLAPNSGQAWLTRATILTVLGRYADARRSCMPLARLAPELVALTAAANVASLTGQAELSCQSLQSALERNASARPSEKRWALTVLAETSARLGRHPDAETHFRRALALGERDTYLLGAFADFLLDQDRPREAMTLLKDETRVDALLLRLALAEAALSPPATALESHVNALRARFEASRLRGDTVHQREEARFTLHLLHQPREAVGLAQANWLVQREPADVRILLEAALAANNSAAGAPALEFVRTNRLEAVQVSELVARLNSLVVQ